MSEPETQTTASALSDTPPLIAMMPPTGWSWPTRVAFRYAFSYFTVYNLSAMMGIVIGFVASVVKVVVSPVAGQSDAINGGIAATITGLLYVPWTAYRNFCHWLIPWVGKHVLHLPKDITIFPAGSGDTTYNYVEVLVFAALALVITLVWSLAAFSFRRHRFLHDLLRVELRYVLAMTLLGYGLAKVFVSQFPAPSLDSLMTTYGESSPMGILWRFIGASAPYEIFGGVMECLGGILLLWRRTTLLGALVTFGVMTNVAMLNFCYDVPVKLYSLHLVAMAVILMLPDVGRLTCLCVLNRPVAPAILRPFAAPLWWRIVRMTFKLVFLGTTFVTMVSGHYQSTKTYGSAAPKPALYGMYEVESFSADGTDLPPLLTDSKRWRRMTVSKWNTITFFKMDGSREDYGVKVDLPKHTIELSAPRARFGQTPDATPVPPLATFAFGEPEKDRLIIEGTLNGAKLDVKLKRIDESAMLLNNRGFHWINEYPFNR